MRDGDGGDVRGACPKAAARDEAMNGLPESVGAEQRDVRQDACFEDGVAAEPAVRVPAQVAEQALERAAA